ncbi:Outer membrane protein TolC [bacterium HR21]|nr:Outer membrane protein TolC [bacterium HR21]
MRWSTVLSWGAIPMVLLAQAPGKRLSLSDCLQRALATHPDIQVAQAQLAAAGAELTAAFGAYLPTLTLSAGYTRQLNVEGGRSINVGGQVIRLPSVDPNAYSLSLIGSYTLFNGFEREGAFQRAQASVAAAEAALSSARQRVATEVIRQYMEVLKAERLIAVRQRSYDLARQELERLRALIEVGRQPASAVYAQEAELSKREVEWLQAKHQYDLAVARLRGLIGVSPTEVVEFADPSIPDSLAPEDVRAVARQWGNFPEMLQYALQHRHDYRAAQHRLEAARALQMTARSGYFPQLTASGGWSWANSALRDFSQLGRTFVGVQLSVPLFENFRTNAQIQSAELQLRQAESELEKLRQNIATELQTAVLTLEGLASQLEAAQRSVRAAEIAAESVRQRYDIGAATQLEYFAAEAQRLSAVVTLIGLTYDCLAAQAQLRFVLGTVEP